MAGIYIHIPFCKVRCPYCDFYSTTSLVNIESLVNCLKAELWRQRNYLSNHEIETIYFGGGTPSLLNPDFIYKLMRAVSSTFTVKPYAEITLEANPDDLNFEYLQQIRQAGINRLSIGIQSFIDNHLKMMNRRHNAVIAKQAIHNAQNAGFNNISIDLIYGLPSLSETEWKYNLDEANALNIQHISAYHLTYHEKTNFWNALHKGIIHEIPEEQSVLQFEALMDWAKENNFVHYEISNFGKNNFFSRHNTSYWQQKQYLGIGPSAHSYNGLTRRWNASSLKKYTQAIEKGNACFEEETLTQRDHYNDYIITSVRTIWGINTTFVESNFGEKYIKCLINNAKVYIESGCIVVDKDILRLTRKGMFISDRIMESLIFIG
jgi:oxygen-independent coproporphyrinogen III oxidase